MATGGSGDVLTGNYGTNSSRGFVGGSGDYRRI